MGKFSHPLKAVLSLRRRAQGRHRLSLAAHASTEAAASKVLIHDLSEIGVGFETSIELQIGDMVLVDLPHIGVAEARIVWRENAFYGCEFITPISQGKLSASLLQSSLGLVDDELDGAVEEVPIGIKPSLDAIKEWHTEFEQTKGANGYRLIGFRQTPEGVMMAMVTKMN
ncbi:MAG: PilZ domain-containing protein [Caenibius sp.]